MDYTYPAVGAFCEKDSSTCTFTVWAPQRNHIEVILADKKGATHPLSRDERGYWHTTLKDVVPGSTYLYRLDHGKILPDPASCWQPQGVHGPSAVIDRSFPWTDDGWKGLPLSEMIIYELHVGTFTSRNDLEGVISKLDYLKRLGINTIELMPLAQFPGERNWGYDGVYPFAVHHGYGGYRALKQLVNEAHRLGIAVVLDVVYNHQGPEGNYFAAYGPFFTDKYKTFWGSAINYDDAYCDGVRHFYWQNALQWLDEFHIDGLRLDAVHAIWDFSAKHFIQELVTKVTALEKRTGSRKVLIAEFDLNNPRYINPPAKGGYGMSGQWTDEFHHALHALITGEVDGYYEDFGSTEDLAKAMKTSYVYTGQYSAHRKKHFGVVPEDNPYSQFVVFTQNHDQIGNRMLGDRLTTQLSFEGLKLTAATLMLSPHVPMLFMGEEYGEKNPFQYFISHTDKELVAMVRKGRKDEFAHFKWQGEVPDPQSEETFQRCVLSWQNESDPLAVKLLEYYQYLITFRKERLAMQGQQRDTVKVFKVTEDKVISFERIFQSDRLLIILNFNKHPASVMLPVPHVGRKIFDSAALKWSGPGEINATNNQPVKLNAESAVIFEING